MQTKSFLEIGLNSQSILAVTDADRLDVAKELKRKTPIQVQYDIVKTLDRFTSGLIRYFRGESEILQSMAQERERNTFLEAKLSAREDRIRPAFTPESREEEQHYAETE